MHYLNLPHCIIHIFNVPSPFSQLVTYSPLLIATIGWAIIPQKRYFLFNQFIAVLAIFVFSYLFIGIISTCIYNSSEELTRILPQYLRAIVDVFLFLAYFLYLFKKNYNIDKQINYITILFFLGTTSVTIFYLLGIEINYIQADQSYGAIDRPSGFFSNPNVAAKNSCITLLLLLYQLFNAPLIKARIGLYLLIFITLGTIFITFSNTGQLAAIGIMLIALFKSRFLTKGSMKSLLVLFVVVLIGIQQTDLSKIEFSKAQVTKIQNLYNVLSFNTNKISYSNRDYISQESIRKSKENPVTGFGLGTYTKVYKIWGTHNTYLGIILDSGFIPLLSYILFIIYVGVRGFLMSAQFRDIGFLFMGWIFLVATYSIASHNVIDNGKFYFLNIVFFILYSCRTSFQPQVKTL